MCHLAMVVPIADAYYIAKNPQMAWKETEVMKKTAIQMKYNFQTLYKSGFVERFPELSLFFKAYSLLDSEMICIFPYFCPYAESAREIREIFS